MKDNKHTIIHILVLFLIASTVSVALYLLNHLSSTHFEEIIFSSFSNVSNSGFSTIPPALKICIPIILVFTIIFYALFYDITFQKIKLKRYPFKHLNRHKNLYTIILFILSLFLLCHSLHIYQYIISYNTDSDFIEKNYVNPKETKISFNNKRNLIFIFVESLENTLFTKEQGGAWNYEVIPELYTLTQSEDSISFDTESGLKMIRGASWTSASIAANNTGLPFKVIPYANAYTNHFVSGSYALGDLLKDKGYYNEVISSANTTFGNLNIFYSTHGNYKIVDIDTLKDYNLSIEKKDKGNWGFNDYYLFELAKERLNSISGSDEPFNLQLITVDTHFFDGFVSYYSEDKFSKQYENSYATESRLINDFVNWIKKQPFYENTTIVIMGDHLAMQSSFINDTMSDNRSVYCTIINPSNDKSISKDRLFTALDTYPTIVSAIGGTIAGEKLGLGVNLFSGEKTLVEKYGLETLDKELQKKSVFYNQEILGIK